MEYLGRTPPPPLAAFVQRIWYCSEAPLHAQERVLPGGGAIDLIVNLADDRIRVDDPTRPDPGRHLSGAIVAGARTRSYLVDPRQRSSLIGVHFRPGGAFPFLGTSPVEIVDAHIQLKDVWGSRADELREQLLEVGSPAAQLELMEAVLQARLRRAREGHPAVQAAVLALRAGASEVRVAEVTTAVGLSHRRFVELFEREVGLTPKLYARLQRFHQVKERIAVAGAPHSWATFALECGYSDQSHMIREFVGFADMTPLSYLRSRTEQTRFDHLVHAYRGNQPVE